MHTYDNNHGKNAPHKELAKPAIQGMQEDFIDAELTNLELLV